MKSSDSNKDNPTISHLLEKLEKVLSEETPPDVTDLESRKEFQDYWDEKKIDNLEDWLKHKRFLIEQQNETMERTLRKENAKKAYNFSLGWAIFIAIIIVLKGFNLWFELTEPEYLATIGVLTITVFTYYTLVLKYLFYKKEKKSEN